MEKNAITEALVAAMMHSSMPMVLSDPHLPDCPMIAFNQAFVDLTGYSRDEMIGRNCRFLQGSKTDPGSAPRIRTCLETGQGCIEWIVNYRRDKSVFWNLLFISPIHDTDGSLLYFFGSQLDITKGFPDWLENFGLGRAHIEPELEREFYKLLQEIGEHTDEAETGSASSRTQALERIVTAAHRVAEISTSLAPGTLERAQTARETSRAASV